MNFVNVNIIVSVMICVIIITRKLFLNKVEHHLFEFLWLAAIMRLCIPYPAETKYNFYNLVYYIREILVRERILRIESKLFYIDRLICSFLSIYYVKVCAFLIWIVGLSIFLRYFINEYKVAKNIINNSVVTPSCDSAKNLLISNKLIKKVSIRQSEKINIPLSFGITKYYIILPMNFEKSSKKDKEQMILHEYMHLKYMHTLLQIIVIIIFCLNWYNPIIWAGYHYIKLDMEIACDRHVLDLIGSEERENYALNLINMSKSNSNYSAFFNGFAKNILKERVEAVMKYKKTSIFALIISIITSLCIVNVFATSDNYIYGDEIKTDGISINVDEIENVELNNYVYIDYENLKQYEIEKTDKAVDSINIVRYEYVTYNQTPPANLRVSTERNGYTYSGTLKLVDMDIDGSKYTGYYSGTLYRE